MTAGRLAAVAGVLAAVAAAGFFDIEQVGEVRLYFAEPNWDEILDSLYAAGEEGRLLGAAIVNGVRFDSVGVRYKGGSSYNPGRRKNPLNIKLDYVRAGQEIEGHGTLRLANVYKDPSFVREVLSYEIARRYMPAGRSNFVNVWINDTLIGLYTNNEDPDRHFVRSHFLSGDGARFKGRLTDSSQMCGWKYFGPDSTAYRHYYELQSDSGWRELVAMLDTLNNHPEMVERVLNLDRHLWMLAFDILLVNLDAPINMPQNFYLFRDPAGRFNPVVWDLNESFGAFRDLWPGGILSVTQMQQLDPFLRLAEPEYPIVSRVLTSPRAQRMYVAHMKTMIEEVFANNWYRDRALAIQDIIDAHVRADRNKFYSYNDFISNVTSSVGSGPMAIVGLTELMNARRSYILGLPQFSAPAPVVSAIAVEPAVPRPRAVVTFRATVTGADSVFLCWRQSPACRFERLPMVARGDSFTASLRVGGGNLQYYIYAENSAAAVFVPARAEHEFFTLPVVGDVVINELMAINNSTVRDPAGQYDDWIELYNAGTRAVSLDGWLLSDDSSDIGRWEFPDITIPAGGFLAVWADADTTQPGLHAGFRLSGTEGTLVLSDPDGRRQDWVCWGPQSADVSFGRWPDGSGTFRLMNPTFLATNDSTVGLAQPAAAVLPELNLSAWPNPVAVSTVVRFNLPNPARVSLRVFDAAGRAVATLVEGELAAGRYDRRLTLPAAAPGGVFFVRLTVRDGTGTTTTSGLKLVRTR